MKRFLSVLLSVGLAATIMGGCNGNTTPTNASGTASTSGDAASSETASGGEASSAAAAEGASAKGKTFAIVTKAAGNPYNEKEADGFKQAIEQEGGTCIVKHPEAATADAQVSVIQSLISQKVDSICIAANDENALQASLQEAMQAGIKVSCLDSKTNKDSRQVFVNQAGTKEIGQALMDAVLDISGGSGDWAILSATSQAANQNAWIEAMKTVMKDAKYSKLNLVEVAYGDDEPQKSTDQTQALLSKYPNLKEIGRAHV